MTAAAPNDLARALYLERCRALVERAVETAGALRDKGVEEDACESIQGFIAHALRQIDQVERRLLRDETIPHEEKVFSIFEEHTRWVSKGKAGTPVELGVPVALIEDQYQFILHHQILWRDLGEPDQGLDRFQLAEEGPDVAEGVMAPVAQQPSCFRGHPPSGFGLVAPFPDRSAHPVDELC